MNLFVTTVSTHQGRQMQSGLVSDGKLSYIHLVGYCEMLVWFLKKKFQNLHLILSDTFSAVK